MTQEDRSFVIRDPNGGCFVVPTAELERWRLPDEEAQALGQALDGDDVKGYFTLIELLPVIAVSDVLIQQLIPNVGAVREAASRPRNSATWKRLP